MVLSELEERVHRYWCVSDTPSPSLSSRLQNDAISGTGGLLTLKSVKRTDSGVYKCSAIDFDNIEAELTGTVTLNVNCEQANDARKQTHTQGCRIK